MTGTQSLSVEQVRTIHREVELVNDKARLDPRTRREPGHGKVVTVVIHQAEQYNDGRKRVQLHRAYADSVYFGVDRSGWIIPASQAR